MRCITEYVSYCTNVAYRRLTALNDLAFNKNFWTDIQSDGVGEYIERGAMMNDLLSLSFV